MNNMINKILSLPLKGVGCALILLFFLFSCSKNDYDSYCPTWKGFTYYTGSFPNYVKGSVGNVNNVRINAGDSIHLTAHQDKRGHLINYTKYTWVICYDTLSTKGEKVHARKEYYKQTNYDGYLDGADDPICHLLLPANAAPTEYGKPDTIMFVARFSYSGQGVTIETGNIVDNTSYNGRITPQSGPTGGGAAGNFYFHVN